MIGHRGLFVFCRELHRSLKIIKATIDAGDRVGTCRQLSRLAAITRACSVWFKVAGNMSADEYENKVLVSMASADPTFTGLWARDHSAMLEQLNLTFHAMNGFDAERAAIKLVTSVMVKQHERVCERFAKGRPSLNVQSRRRAPSGGEEGYLRLRNYFGPRHLRRLETRDEPTRTKCPSATGS